MWRKYVCELGEVLQPHHNECKKLTDFQKGIGGAGYRSRYLSHAKRALYHLSYAPFLKIWGKNVLNKSRPNCWKSYPICTIPESFIYHSPIYSVLRSFCLCQVQAALTNSSNLINHRLHLFGKLIWIILLISHQDWLHKKTPFRSTTSVFSTWVNCTRGPRQQMALLKMALYLLSFLPFCQPHSSLFQRVLATASIRHPPLLALTWTKTMSTFQL